MEDECSMKTNANMMKNLHRLLLGCAVSLISMSTVDAQTIEKGPDGLNYQITSSTDRTAILSYQDNTMQYGDLTLPTSVTLYDGIEFRVTGIGISAFNHCSGLTSVTIPDSYTEISIYAFNYCQNLKQVNMTNSITSIGGWAFSGCSSLSSITLSNAITEIPLQAFSYCSSLKQIDLPAGLKRIGESAFIGSGLTSITIPDNTKEIKSSAFWGCKSLQSVTIGNSLSKIGQSAFYGCTALGKITLPASVSEIGVGAWADCTSLTEIAVTSDNKSFTSVDGALYNKEKSQLLAFPLGKKDTHITLPSSLTAIGDNAFNGCSMTSITIPAQVSSIGRYAFANCKNLTSIDLPQSVNTIGEGAFSQSGLRSVIIPKRVREISYNLLNNCENLSTVTLYQGITKIGAGAFAICKSLSNISLPPFVTEIGAGAFAGSGLTECYIGTSVSKIGDGIFSGCENLTKVTVDPANPYYTLQDDVIYTKDMTTTVTGLDPITSLTLPSTVTSIGERSFSYCGNITELNLPSSLHTIGIQAFLGCSGLTKVDIPEGVVSVAGQAFGGCSNLTEITIPSTTKDFGPWIEENEYLNIPEGGVLMSCNNLQKIYCKTVTPPEASDRVTICPFEILSSGTLYVPTGTAEAYKAAPGWRYFKNIVEMDFSGIDAVETEQKPKVTVADGRVVVSGDCGLAVEIFAVNGTLMFNGSSGSIPALGHGIYIVRVGNTTEKVIL